jgi:hypothetical protein
LFPFYTSKDTVRQNEKSTIDIWWHFCSCLRWRVFIHKQNTYIEQATFSILSFEILFFPTSYSANMIWYCLRVLNIYVLFQKWNILCREIFVFQTVAVDVAFSYNHWRNDNWNRTNTTRLYLNLVPEFNHFQEILYMLAYQKHKSLLNAFVIVTK